ncbi:MAG: alpha/beta fold hydrolase [Oceanospirillaceae bacterium]
MKLNYKISGAGAPLIILHGLFGTLENWGGQVAVLNQSFQVINVDLRNHGRSPHSNIMNYQVMADDIIELLDELEIPAASIIGHSMGGKVAMQIALQYPDRVHKLVVVDISPVSYPTTHHDEIFKGLTAINLETLNSRTAANEILQAYVTDPDIRSFLLKNLYRNEDKAFKWRPNLSILEQEYTQLSCAPISKQAAFENATLFIKGKNSDYMLKEHQEIIDALFESVQFKMIEGAGHWPHAEKPKVFSAIIHKFLS